MGRKKKDDKAKGETRRRIEEGIQNFENLTVRFTSIQDKFGKALQASLRLYFLCCFFCFVIYLCF